MGHGSDLTVGIFHHQHVLRSQGGEECRAVTVHLEEHEVRGDPVRIESAGRRLGDATRARHAGHLGQGLREAAGVGVVVGEAVDHPFRAVAQGEQPSRGDDPGLAHAATDELPAAPRSGDHLAPTDDDGSDRAAQSLGQAERHGVGRIGEVTLGHTRGALGDDRVPEACAIEVQRHVVSPGDGRDGPGIGGGQRLAHGVGVGVLQGDQPGERLVAVVGVAEGVLDRLEIQGPVRSIGEGPGAGPDDDRVTGLFVDHEVVRSAGDHLRPPAEVGDHGDEVAHRATRHEQPGFLAEQLRRALFQRDDGGVVAEHVVTDRCGGHRGAHRVRGARHGIAAKVDQIVGHRPGV